MQSVRSGVVLMEELVGVRHPDEVQFYSSHEHELKHSQVHKAHKFLEFHCIGYDMAAKVFFCLPIEGYNKTTYYLKPDKDVEGGFACDCQRFQMQAKQGLKAAAWCSHLLALHYWFDARNKAHGWGKYKG